MKLLSKGLFIILLLSGATSASGQAETGNFEYKNFPVMLTLQFHGFTMPLKDMKSNFSNIGIGLGTEVSLNGKRNLVQQFNLVYYTNKRVGNGIAIYTQSVWRPYYGDHLYNEIKLGVGHLYSYRPNDSYSFVDDKWVFVRKTGKGMLTIPIGIGMGYDFYENGNQFGPFVNYQFLPTKGYNNSIPVVPNTLIQTGISIHH